MDYILLIVGFIVGIQIIRAINNLGLEQNKSELSLIQKKHKGLFPNGRKDIEEGTKELLRILNNSVDVRTARSIFMKSSINCYSITRMKGEFSKDRLKQHLAPYALNHFNDNTLSRFYDYILSKS